MHACARGGFDHQRRIDFAKTGDVIGHRAVKQLDVLRQVTQVRPQFVFAPAVQVGAVQPHGAGQRWPHADHQARQSGFARAAGADYRHTFAGGNTEVDVSQNGLLAARRSRGDAFKTNRPLRRGHGHACLTRRVCVEQLVQPGPGGAAGDDLFPVAYQGLHRRQRPADQHRGGDHAAWRHLAFEHQQGAKPQRKGLHGDAHELRQAAHHGGLVARGRLQRNLLLVQAMPALADARQHAHGFNGFGIAQVVGQGHLRQPVVALRFVKLGF